MNKYVIVYRSWGYYDCVCVEATNATEARHQGLMDHFYRFSEEDIIRVIKVGKA